MLKDIHLALRQLLYAHAGINSDELDIRFETPTEEWVNSLTVPTVSFFLFDIRENTEKRETNLQTVRGTTRGYRRMPPRRIDLFYLASAFCTDVDDEHLLLWRLLATLMKYRQLPEDLLPDSLKSLDPAIVTRIEASQESRNVAEIWNALGLRPHPAVCYAVTAPLDLDIALEAPLVFTKTTRFGGLGFDLSDRTAVDIGGTVRDNSGTPLQHVTIKRDSSSQSVTTNVAGQYMLQNVPTGVLSLTVLEKSGAASHVEFSIPSESYDIIVEG
jgi:hypothetical protein